MLLPSGPANMRCSACRFEPRSLHVQLRRAPGTGLRSPETGSLILGYRDLSRQQRPQVSHLNPRKCPQIAGYLAETRNGRLASNCVVGPGEVAQINVISSLRVKHFKIAHWDHYGSSPVVKSRMDRTVLEFVQAHT